MGDEDEPAIGFDVVGTIYELPYDDVVWLATALRSGKHNESAVPAADRLEQLLTGAVDGPLVVTGDDAHALYKLVDQLTHPDNPEREAALALFRALGAGWSSDSLPRRSA